MTALLRQPFRKALARGAPRAAAAASPLFNSSITATRRFLGSLPVAASLNRKATLEGLLNQYRVEDRDRALLVNDTGNAERQLRRFSVNLPEVKPFYAVKCNPDPVLIDTLARLDANFDCASRAEIELVLAAGVAPERIIFANPIKNPLDLIFAREKKVLRMTYDNHDEVAKIKKHCPEAQLVLRLLPDDSGALCRFGSKFGAPIEVVEDLLLLAQRESLEVVGVSFHIGSGCQEPERFMDAISLAREAFDIAAKAGLPPLRLVDIGGGLPGHAVPHERSGSDLETPAFEEIASVIRRAFARHFPPEQFPHLERIAEPGRYFALAFSTLFLRVQGRREVYQRPGKAAPDEPKKFLYYVNDGVYGSFNCKMFDYYHPTPRTVQDFFKDTDRATPHVALQPSTSSSSAQLFEQAQPAQMQQAAAFSTEGKRGGALTSGTFFGPTCDSLDKIAEDFIIPELMVGDYVVFEDMGAYTTTSSTEFNGCRFAHKTYFRSLVL